jgi:hypothetical protein
MYLRVPVIEYNSEPQNTLIKEVLDNRYIFQLKKFECIPITNVSGTTLHTDITNMIKSTTTSPIWAFVVFQTNKSNNQLADNSKFHHVNVKNLWFDINGKHYPEDIWELDFNNG